MRDAAGFMKYTPAWKFASVGGSWRISHLGRGVQGSKGELGSRLLERHLAPVVLNKGAAAGRNT